MIDLKPCPLCASNGVFSIGYITCANKECPLSALPNCSVELWNTRAVEMSNIVDDTQSEKAK